MKGSTEDDAAVLPLSHLRPGQKGTILKIGGEKLNRRRFLEMGLVKGETVTAMKQAPLGDPIQYQVKGYNISLRLTDSEKIIVLSEVR